MVFALNHGGGGGGRGHTGVRGGFPPGGGGGGRGGRQKKEFTPSTDPIDKAEKAEIEREFERRKIANDRLRAENERNYNLEIVAFSDYLAKKNELEKAGIQIDIDRLDEQASRIIGNIQKLEARQQTVKPNTAEGERVKKELDDQEASLIKIDSDVNKLKASLIEADAQTLESATKAFKESEIVAEETRQKYLELLDAKRDAAGVEIGLEFDRIQLKQAIQLSALEAARQRAIDAGNTQNQTIIEAEIARLKTIQDQTNEIRKQKELNADYADIQESINKLDDQRKLALDRLNNRLIATGASEDDATKQRRELMTSYAAKIDDVIKKLKALQAQGAKNPEIQKTIDGLEIGKESDALVPFTEKLNDAKLKLDAGLKNQQDALTANELSGNSGFETDQNRLQIIRDTNDALLAQANAYVELAKQSGNTDLIKQAEDQRNAIQRTGLEVQSYGKKLRGVAIDAFASGLTQFFSDLASGTKSASQALLDFAGSFVQAIQQMIVQLLAYMAVALILKAFGISIPGFITQQSGISNKAGGGAVAGKRDGGAVAGLANGGSPLQVMRSAPTGYVRGAGTSRSDSILTYFPAAQRLTRISNTEYVLDAETTRNMTVAKLDQIRAHKGRNLETMFLQKMNTRNLADGGAVSVGAAAGSSGANNSPAPELRAGDVHVNSKQLNVVETQPIEKIISNFFAGAAGDKIFVNLMNRNPSLVKNTVKGN